MLPRKHVTTVFLVLALMSMLSSVAAAQTPAPVTPPSGDPILIGLEGPMTGDMAYEGKGFEQAITLLAKQTNDGRRTSGPPGADRRR